MKTHEPSPVAPIKTKTAALVFLCCTFGLASCQTRSHETGTTALTAQSALLTTPEDQKDLETVCLWGGYRIKLAGILGGYVDFSLMDPYLPFSLLHSGTCPRPAPSAVKAFSQ